MPQATGSALTSDETECRAPGEAVSTYEAKSVVRHLAHELRQPLSTIESIAYYLGMVLPHHESRMKKQVDKLQQVVHQANWILSDAVHYLQANPPAPQTLDLDEFVSLSVTEVAKGDSVRVHLELCETPTLLRFDPEQLRHLLRTLLLFFRQISGGRDAISVRTARKGDEVVIEFQTAGECCEPHQLQSMLEPFSAHLPAGSGLALASVQRISEVHGGRVALAGDQDGQFRLVVTVPAGD